MRTPSPERISRRTLLLLEAALLSVLVLSWTVAYLAAQGALDELPIGSRNYLLALYVTEGRLWPALILGFVGAGLLLTRHWWPTASFVGVSAVILYIEWTYPYLTRVQFASTIMLLVSAFWALWLTPRFRLLAVAAVAVAGATTAASYEVNRNLSTASSLDLTSERLVDLGSAAATLQSMVLVAVAIAAAALVRRFDEQTVELAQRNRELTEQRAATARAAVLDERVRIARELHDVVAHHVTTMTVHAGAARQVVAVKPETVTESLQQIEQAGRDAVLELQRLLGFLRGDDDGRGAERDGRRSSDANGRGPAPSLRDLDRLGTSLGSELQCEWHLDGDFDAVPQSVEVSAYRIVQEALTNVLKHSTANRAAVAVAAGADEVSIRVTDPGLVAPGDRRAPTIGPPSGHGLVGMRERASLHGGTISVGPAPGGGWLVEAVLPYEVSGQ
ncbi:MAG: sensor histidine kinase [Actinomycetota bacterium]